MNLGFKIIREMTKEEMIAELMKSQRILFEQQDEDTLKRHVIQARLMFTQRRLVEEADLEGPVMFGAMEE